MDYTKLESILTRRLAVIEDAEMRQSDPEKQLQLLMQVSEELEVWKSEHLSEVPAKLRHFLDQYSLEKALVFIKS